MGTLWQDIRYGTRLLRNNPAFVAVAVLTLAFGIGANVAIFSLVDVVLFRPLPIKNPGEVVRLTAGRTRGVSEWGFLSFPSYLAYRERSSAFSGMAAYLDRFPVTVSAGRLGSDRVDAGMVTGNYFPTVGVNALVGRALSPADDEPGASPVVMLSHEYWKRRFASDPAAIGLQVLLDGRQSTIVGITPAGFGGVSFENLPEVWLPMSFGFQVDPILKSQIPLAHESFGPFAVIARLKSGVSIAQAQAQLDAIAAGLGAGKEVSGDENGFVRPWPVLVPATAQARKFQSQYSLLVMGIVALVLLIACADAASLLLARAENRQKEVAVRLALGATRGRIVQLHVIEGLLVSLPGALVGALLADWGSKVLVASAPATLPLPIERAVSVLDLRVLGFTALVAILSGVVSSLAPAVKLSRSDLLEVMKGESRALNLLAHRVSLQNLLVIIQVAASVVLLVGAGLLMRTLWAASTVKLGFDPDHTLTVSVDPGRQGYDAAAASRLLDPLLDSLRAQPGVESAALANWVPLQPGMETAVALEGRQPGSAEGDRVQVVMATPGYFETLGIPLFSGRDFTAADSANAHGVAIISLSMAQKFWPGNDPIGKHITRMGAHDQTFEIVGVAGNVAPKDPREPLGPVVYVPFAQSFLMFPWQPVITTLARTRDGPRSLVPAVRAAVARVNPDLAIFRVRTMQDQVAQTLAEERFLARLLAIFALLATTLCAAGVYGLVSYTTQGATREFGVRMALGAQSGDVFWMVLLKGLALASAGLLIGLAGALGLTHVLLSFLYGVGAIDPPTIAGVALLIAAVTAIASFMPAWRAARVDPLVALRHE
ncbi:MAG TPA: ABC transporter permease [Candidatus Acidoferrales bacterium]|nr:ABC transporter permease [Candidatus Acidoferrales bacterium]